MLTFLAVSVLPTLVCVSLRLMCVLDLDGGWLVGSWLAPLLRGLIMTRPSSLSLSSSSTPCEENTEEGLMACLELAMRRWNACSSSRVSRGKPDMGSFASAGGVRESVVSISEGRLTEPGRSKKSPSASADTELAPLSRAGSDGSDR